MWFRAGGYSAVNAGGTLVQGVEVHLEQRIGDGGVELAPGLRDDLLQGPLALSRRLVGPLVSEGVEHVGDRGDAARSRG
jgi:hypothetical protein